MMMKNNKKNNHNNVLNNNKKMNFIYFIYIKIYIYKILYNEYKI